MFTWLRNLFATKPEPLILIDPVEVREEVSVPKKPKKVTSKKVSIPTVDLESLSKTQLLDLAKSRGVKANASLKRDEILARIESAN